MNSNNTPNTLQDLYEFFDELDDHEKVGSTFSSGKRRPRVTGRHPKKMSESNLRFKHEQDDSRGAFKFTYKAARFEEWWLLESLGAFYEHKWISDVTRRIKGGKEASVYQCKPGAGVDAPLLAAKVYRPRSLRNLKNDQQYRVGRTDLDEEGNLLWKEADVNAIIKRTSYGEEVRHQSWIAYEFVTMELLYEAGMDIPRPYAKEKNAVLMEFVGDAGTAAPPLSHLSLDRDEAQTLFDRVIRNIDIMLAKDRIHGDLSAYNILYWDGEIKFIDFPQVVFPESNPASWQIFRRDVTRICQYFSAQGVRCNSQDIAADLWTSHGHRIFEKVHPKYLDPDKPEDRTAWERQKKSDAKQKGTL
jgi:RIO kinase 1